MDAAAHRTYLFVPGNRPERFDKACAAGADVVILDLEDAVPPEDKGRARGNAAAWLAAPDASRPVPVLVRINASGTAWYRDDLDLCAVPGAAGIMLPKAEQPETLGELRRAGAASVLPLIETAKGFANAQALASAPGVQRLAFGAIDFQLDLGIAGGGEELLFFRSQLVLASRLAGVAAPVDGVTTAIDDADLLRDETLRARRLGFGGKLCIHPKQVGPVKQAFLPTQEEVAWARRILKAAEAADGAAVAVDGKMVDRPVILKAADIMSRDGSR